MTTTTDPPGESEREGRFVDFSRSRIACREATPAFRATVRRTVELPAPAYDLWCAGRLGEVLGISDDRHARIEIIGARSSCLNRLTTRRRP